MNVSHGSIDLYALEILFFALLLGFFVRKKTVLLAEPTLFFSTAEFPPKSSHYSPLAQNVPVVFWIAFFLLCIGFLNPRIFHHAQRAHPMHREGSAFYVLIDRSSSMNNPSSVRGTSKLDLAKQFAQRVIRDHPQDLIGLVSFARIPTILSPLAFDTSNLLSQLAQLRSVAHTDEDGTALGYAVYKTAQLISTTRRFAEQQDPSHAPYQIQHAALFLLTDGLQHPNPQDYGNSLRTMDLEEAAEKAKQEGIRVYVINMHPSLASLAFTPQRKQLEHFAESTGGKLLLLNDAHPLEQVYRTIDSLERETLPDTSPTSWNATPLAPYLIAPALALLLLALLAESLIIRRVP